MIAAVCCPGPFLPSRWRGRAGFDVVWAVNRALIAVPEADWLSAGDHALYEGLLGDHRPRVGCLTAPTVVERFATHASWRGLTWRCWGQLPLVAAHHDRGRPPQWSVQAALCHAAALGAQRIDLFGCDGAAGGRVEDCTGYAGENRTAERWEREERDLAFTFELLAEAGVHVYRHSPRGA